MDIIDILGLFFLGCIALIIVVGIILSCISSKETKEAWELFDHFESIRKLKKTKPDEFIDKSFKIITRIKPGNWKAFRVKESKYRKGWFVESDYFDEKRFWPSSDKLGNKYYPDFYLSKEKDEHEMLDVLEKIVDFIIYCEKTYREIEKTRED
jgi:hypothetical protein